MKKVGLITIHNANNYGAVLQAYALQQAIIKLGYDCKIIDYTTKTELNDKKLFSFKLSIGSVIGNIRTLLSYSARKKRNRGFENFTRNNYKLTDKSYKELSELSNEDFDFDVFVTGSDQTFNLYLRGDIEARKAYFLPFVKCGRKISYASSMGEKMNELQQQDKEWMAARFKEYDHISVREINAAKFINELTGLKPEIVVDPTLLLDAEDWQKLCTEKIKSKDDYILFYSVLSDSWVIDKVNQISKITGLKVIAPHLKNRYELSTNYTRATEASPTDFLNLIKNAKLVCVTSFHGTVFSLLFNVPFVSFKLGEANRLTNLLNKAGLSDRMITSDSEVQSDFLLDMDFENANKKISVEKEHSWDFLKNALKD